MSSVVVEADRVALVDEAIESRQSIRAFLSKPVKRQIIHDILRVASRAPSGSNIQPWKTYVLQNQPLADLIDKVCQAHDAVRADPSLRERYQEPFSYYPENWFEPYLGRRRENGWGLYGLLGIKRGEKEKMHAQHQRNFRFFDAPVGLVFTVNKALGQGTLIDIGGYMQNIMTAARARGLDTCPQAAWNPFESIVLRQIGAQPDETLVCAMALGWADPAAKVNTLRTPREPVENFTVWCD
ncbi:MAG TPA: nitroreductase [Burkholderiaceae bacterium]|nr:nitroreductase [Burkholderiaceae bacterium]